MCVDVGTEEVFDAGLDTIAVKACLDLELVDGGGDCSEVAGKGLGLVGKEGVAIGLAAHGVTDESRAEAKFGLGAIEGVECLL